MNLVHRKGSKNSSLIRKNEKAALQATRAVKLMAEVGGGEKKSNVPFFLTTENFIELLWENI